MGSGRDNAEESWWVLVENKCDKEGVRESENEKVQRGWKRLGEN